MLRTLLVIGLGLLFSLPTQARPSCDWPFRTSIQVQQIDVDGLTNYPVDLVLTNSNMPPFIIGVRQAKTYESLVGMT